MRMEMNDVKHKTRKENRDEEQEMKNIDGEI